MTAIVIYALHGICVPSQLKVQWSTYRTYNVLRGHIKRRCPFYQLFCYCHVMLIYFFLSFILNRKVEFVDGKQEAKFLFVEIERSVCEGQDVFCMAVLLLLPCFFAVLEGSKMTGIKKALASFILYLQPVIMGQNVCGV